MSTGTIYLLPTLLGDEARTDSLCGWETGLLQELKVYFTENEKSARRFLRKAGFTGSFDDITLHRVDKDTRIEEQLQLLTLVRNGTDAGVLSEAGAPAIADPGASLLALAHDMGIPVVPIPGPSAIMLSIMGSGLNGQQFTFHGYLPIDKIARTRKLRELEQISFQTGYAQFFIETPYRNIALLEDCFQVLNPATRLCIGVNLTLQDGWIRTIPVSRWKQNKPAINKLPAVFGILKSS